MFKRILLIILIILSLYPLGELLYILYSYHQGNSAGKNSKSAERFRKPANSKNQGITSESTGIADSSNTYTECYTDTGSPFEKNIKIGIFQYEYCFSFIEKDEKENSGLFNVYRRDDSLFLVKLVSPSKSSRFPHNGILLNLRKSEKNSDSNLFYMNHLKHRTKQEVSTWMSAY